MSYYQKTLYPFIEKLIRFHNYDRNTFHYELSVDDIELWEQYEFAAHLIEYYKRDLNCIYENDHHDDIVSSLVNLLKNDSKDNKLNFSELVMEKTVDFYKIKMQELIDDAISWVQQEDFEEKGFKPLKHSDNGETYWVKA